MSKSSSSPNYCSCTVNQARNLPDKGKSGGVNAFCTISMGKAKFVTAVREKTTSPDWHEQCDMPIVDDARIKLTVYNNNKNSLSTGDFIGRAHISLRDLQDYDLVHTSWHKLSNKDGKFDKDRGEIEASLQFYSKNNTTGSVLDLSTKKKHLSLTDVKQSLKEKLKREPKDRKSGGENQLGDQRRRLDGDDVSTNNVRDFLNDSVSEERSSVGSHISVNSMSYNNNVAQRKEKLRAPNNGTPYSSHRSITSDYETSSILDSASMYGGDETSTPALPVRSQTQQREVNVDENSSSKNTSNKKKTKAPIPTIITTKLAESTDHSREFSVRTDDIESEKISKSDKLVGLTTIKENLDTDEYISSSKYQEDEEIDFNNYFNQNQEKKTKKTAPIIPQSKEKKLSISSQYDDIQTPPTSISVQMDPALTFSTIKTQSDNKDDATDEDVDELLGKLKPDNKISGGSNQTSSKRNRDLPDIVKLANSTPGPKKPVTNGLNVLGYENVESTPVNPKIRQELDHLNHEDLLRVISYQTDLLEKRDKRLKDLQHYTDGLLSKIVEQCPAILQVGNSSKR